MPEIQPNRNPKAAALKIAAVGLLTAGFLSWTVWLLADPLQVNSRNENRLEVADRLGYIERALQDATAGKALIATDPPTEALTKWQVLFSRYRKQIEQLRPEDPAVQEIAPYLTRVYGLVDRAEAVRQDILAGKYNPEQIESAEREFLESLEMAKEETRAAAQLLRRSSSQSTLGSPGYPIAAGVLAVLLCAMVCRSEWRLAHPSIHVVPTWPSYSEPNGMDALRRMAGRFAHNFNNLLTTINGYTDLVLSSIDEEDPNRADLEEVKRAGTRAALLTGSLLAFSGHQVAKPKLVDLSELIRSMEGSIATMLGSQSRLELDLSEHLDQVFLDPAQFAQVVLNLAANARDAMPDGGTFRISAANAEPDQVGVLVTLKDTGIGIEEEIREQVFEPFFTTHEPGKSPGLGLSAAYGIVRQNGGAIRVRSEKGQGTTFAVCFPSGKQVRMRP